MFSTSSVCLWNIRCIGFLSSQSSIEFGSDTGRRLVCVVCVVSTIYTPAEVSKNPENSPVVLTLFLYSPTWFWVSESESAGLKHWASTRPPRPGVLASPKVLVPSPQSIICDGLSVKR